MSKRVPLLGWFTAFGSWKIPRPARINRDMKEGPVSQRIFGIAQIPAFAVRHTGVELAWICGLVGYMRQVGRAGLVFDSLLRFRDRKDYRGLRVPLAWDSDPVMRARREQAHIFALPGDLSDVR